MPEKVEVEDDTFEILEERAGEKGFDNTDEYVNYVLNQVADKVRRKKGRNKGEGFSEKDEEKVKERLRGLGYLD
ncbi:MAG: CopG family transcriptional regulator [Candidatus Nanohaloarchaea archaeon]|nr:CopG family transcriptional regulator [Candidatus Nanohaloarchaea archaeon]